MIIFLELVKFRVRALSSGQEGRWRVGKAGASHEVADNATLDSTLHQVCKERVGQEIALR